MNYIMTEDKQIVMDVGSIRTMCIFKWSILSKSKTLSEEPDFSCFLQTRVFLVFNFLSYSLRKIPFHFFPRGIFYSCSFLLTAKYVFLNSVFIDLKTIT